MLIVEPTAAQQRMLISYVTCTLLVFDHWVTTLLLLVTCWVVPLGVVELIETLEFESEIPEEVLMLSTIATSFTDELNEPEVVTVTVDPFDTFVSLSVLSTESVLAAAAPESMTINTPKIVKAVQTDTILAFVGSNFFML
jgi:hypothetical protein